MNYKQLISEMKQMKFSNEDILWGNSIDEAAKEIWNSQVVNVIQRNYSNYDMTEFILSAYDIVQKGCNKLGFEVAQPTFNKLAKIIDGFIQKEIKPNARKTIYFPVK